jgi:hypothetical protein
MGEWMTIGQPMSRSLGVGPPSDLAFAASQMVDQSTAGGFGSIIALAGESTLIALAVFLYTEWVLSFIQYSVRLTLNVDYIVKGYILIVLNTYKSASLGPHI